MAPALFLGTFRVTTVFLGANESELDKVYLEPSLAYLGGVIFHGGGGAGGGGFCSQPALQKAMYTLTTTTTARGLLGAWRKYVYVRSSQCCGVV